MKSNPHRLRFLLLLALVQLCAVPSVSARVTGAARLAQQSAASVQEQQVRGTRKTAMQAALVNAAELAREEALNPAPLAETSMKAEPPEELEEEMPLPPGATVIPDTSPSAPSSILPAVASPTPDASFMGFGYSSWVPPDSHGAVGPSHLLVTLNGRFGVQDKTGKVLLQMSLSQFWSKLTPLPPDIFDPKVLYDPYGQRFIITSCATRNSADSSVLLGVSQTNDPTGNWFVYKVDADADNVSWADFPSIGFNKNWIVVHMNMFPISGVTPAPQFQSRFWVFDKANAYAGNGSYTEIKAPGYGSTIVPVVTYDPNLETLYLLQTYNAGVLRYYSITSSGGSPVFTPGPFLSVTDGWSYSAPNVNGSSDFAPQRDATEKIQANDSRMHSAVYRNGSIWGAHTVFLPSVGPTRSAIQWVQINPTGGGIVQRGRIDDPTGGTFYAFPSIAVNKNNDVLVGYSRFRANEFGSAAYSYRAASDPPGTMQGDMTLKAGEDFYVHSFESRNRWGDYSATTVDPTDDVTMWTLQEYATPRATFGDVTSSGRWGTWWGRFGSAPPPPPRPLVQFFAANVSAPENVGGIPITVRRSGDLSVTSSISYATSNGTASDVSDYSAAYGTLTFAPGEESKSFTLFITNDALDEPNETLTISLSLPEFAVIGPIATITFTINDDDAADGLSPVRGGASFNAQFFVRQHYIDFFNREPDASGLAFWTGQATNCGATDLQVCRNNVSAAFFVSTEFQETGYFVYKMYQAAYGARIQDPTTGIPTVPLTLREFLPDLQQTGRGVVVGQGNWQQQLEQNKQAYVNEFVQRALFTQRYPAQTSVTAYIDALNANTGNSLTQAERDSLVTRLGNAQISRAQALREVAENAAFGRRFSNRAFVLMQYFGYMRRNPYDAPELHLNFEGYNFWLNKLNQFGGNYITSQMVQAFITSGEYEQRFGK